MNDLLLRLRDKGNTVLVVEHKPETIAIADHVVDLGPGAGADGGRICFTGDVAGLRRSDTLTGRHLDHRVDRCATAVRNPTGHLPIRERRPAQPAATSTSTSRSGSSPWSPAWPAPGKSSLIHGSLRGRDGVVVVDQSPIRGSRRSNPATYTGLLDPIRTAFAKANGVKAALFSANSEGACPTCKGIGLIYTDLAMMAGVASVCERCEGRRFTDEVLTYTLRGKNISEVLGMSVTEAHDFFPRAGPSILDRLADVGLGYLSLGQPLTTLSGGERQRLKLAIHMAEKTTTYVLDEPTTGLHLADVDQLLALLDRLVDAGNTVIVIEHHQAVMAHADWLIDLGPGAGHDGGRIVFTGTPAELVATGDTLTAKPPPRVRHRPGGDRPGLTPRYGPSRARRTVVDAQRRRRRPAGRPERRGATARGRPVRPQRRRRRSGRRSGDAAQPAPLPGGLHRLRVVAGPNPRHRPLRPAGRRGSPARRGPFRYDPPHRDRPPRRVHRRAPAAAPPAGRRGLRRGRAAPRSRATGSAGAARSAPDQAPAARRSRRATSRQRRGVRAPSPHWAVRARPTARTTAARQSPEHCAAVHRRMSTDSAAPGLVGRGRRWCRCAGRLSASGTTRLQPNGIPRGRY